MHALWQNVPVVDVARLSRKQLAVAGGLVVLLAIALSVALAVRSGEGPPAASRQVTRLKDLPARPEEIEAHGASGRSVLEPDDARERNAAVPFWPGLLRIARPFAFNGSDEDRSQALQCLATAILYEAGDDTTGEAAVAQVVLNRVRHPAFPATICGVVYQGAERSTGCQFTFTCDGSLRRQMPEAAWLRAREVAERALAGKVDESVGLATHYHTNWVYPYWSPELRKLARVGTHLFFGWPGSWGGPYAFRREYRGKEGKSASAVVAAPETPELLQDEDFELPPRILGLPQAPVRLPSRVSKVPLYGTRIRLAHPDGRAFGLLARPDAEPAKLVNAALSLCAKLGPCEVIAWTNEDDIPGEYPIPEDARATMVFEYLREGAGGTASLRFDCERLPNKDPRLCLPASRQLPPELSGIRWKAN